MSTRERESLGPAIGVGVAVGLGVLFAQAGGLPSVRVGPLPLAAGAIGTVGAIAWLLARGAASERFASTWDALAEESEQR